MYSSSTDPRALSRLTGLALLCLLLACSSKQPPPSRPSRPVPVVAVEKVLKKPVVHQIEVIGELQPQEDTLVPTKVSGVVLKILFQEGDRVSPGAALVEIEPTEYRASADRARAAVSIAKADILVKQSLAVAAAARIAEAMAQQADTQAKLASAELAVKLAEADVDVAEAVCDVGQTGLARAKAFQAETGARLKAAQTMLGLSKDTLDRKTALRKDGYATEEVFLQAKAEFESAQARLDEAQAAIESAQAGFQQAQAEVAVSQAKVEPARKRVAQAQSQVAQAKIQLDLAQARIEEAEAQRHAAQAEIERSRAALEQAASELSLAEWALANTIVRTVIGGQLIERKISTGEWAESDTAVARIVDNRTLKVKFVLSAAEAAQVSPGMPVRFTVSSHPDREFQGTIFFVSDHADPATRTVEVKARFENSEHLLRSGTFCRVQVDAKSRADALVVSETAVLPTEGGFIAFVLDGDSVLRREVQLGLRSRGIVEVLQGLRENEEVIVRGAHSVSQGMKVQVARESPVR